MRHITVGAGASLAEAISLDLPPEQHPPLISNFAQKLWGNFNPHPFLDRYLESLGHKVSNQDGRPLFYELEQQRLASVEGLFEYVWIHRNKSWDVEGTPPGFLQGLFLYSGSGDANNINDESRFDFLQNLIYHGIKTPLMLIMATSFFEQGQGYKQLVETKKVIGEVKNGDLILNLNYDTLLEIGLKQNSISFQYAPVQKPSEDIVVCKPHGSLNLVEFNNGFEFGNPEWLGTPLPLGSLPGGGILPPRTKKNYKEHPIARIILDSIKDRKPDVITFWGVGFTDSDIDLLTIYRAWTQSAKVIEIINPDDKVSDLAKRYLVSRNVKQYKTVDEWLQSIN